MTRTSAPRGESPNTCEGVKTVGADVPPHENPTLGNDPRASQDARGEPPAACPHCGQKAEERICSKCGERMMIIGCGHYIPNQSYSTDSNGNIFCRDCYPDYDLKDYEGWFELEDD